MLNKLLSKAKDKLIDMIKTEPFRQKEKAQLLTTEQQFGLNLGSILAEQRDAYCNALEMGEEDLQDVIEGLEQFWEISDQDSAKETLNWLLSEGHRALYPHVLNGLKYDDEDTLAQYVFSITNDEEIGAKIYHFTNHLKGAKKDLIEFDVIQADSDLHLDISAWDTGRCVAVTRMCYEANYLNEKEAWEFIEKAAELSIPLYSSWKEFGNAYAIGRAMWSGAGMSLDNVLFDYKNHMEHERSPWTQHPWQK